jgi:predicted phosphodiesterase
MIYFLGDLHGGFERLELLAEYVNPDDIIIQVGDFGLYPTQINYLNSMFGGENKFPCKIYAIDGNHEHFPTIIEQSNNEMWEFCPNMFYVPRGTVLELDGHLVGFLGGADSVDKSWREPYGKWHWQETITENDLQTLIENVGDRQLDILVAHAAPPKLIANNFAPLNHNYWRLPVGWVDVSSNRVEEAIRILTPTQFVCGHMHKSVTDGNQRILDINEVVDVEKLLSNG